jgi:SAM-dependent methyltransferase
MRTIDRLLQRARIRACLPWIKGCTRVIDVGAHQGELFRALGSRLESGFGIEPLVSKPVVGDRYVIQPGLFPQAAPDAPGSWDAVTMLAVLEHIPAGGQAAVAEACHRLLRTGGRVVITVPSPAVDRILAVLKALRLIDGMSLEEHYGFRPGDTERIFPAPRFALVCRRHFQFGLNNLFVFEKR